MANRFIKSSIWTSPNLNQLDDQGEVLFHRLIPLPDDHGCFEADPRILKGQLFPLKDSWTIDIICYQLISLVIKDLISLWIENKRLYGVVLEWEKHQQCRTKFKRKTPIPPPPDQMLSVDDCHKLLRGIVINCYQMISVAIPPPSSLLSPPSPLPSSLNNTPPKTDSAESGEQNGRKRVDPVRDIYLDSIISEIKSKLKVDCSYPQAGNIINMAGGIHEYNLWGYVVIAIDKVSKWRTSEAWYGALKTELRRIHTDWSDDERQRLAKAFSDKKHAEIEQKVPQRMKF